MIRLLPGDVFVVDSGGFFGTVINFFSRLSSKDHNSSGNHAGVVNAFTGETIEMLASGCTTAHLSRYKGCRIILARPHANKDDLAVALHWIRSRVGRRYPWWRLPLFIAPPLAQYISYNGEKTCSEQTARFLSKTGAYSGRYMGKTPDNLADEWRTSRAMTILYDGVL